MIVDQSFKEPKVPFNGSFNRRQRPRLVAFLAGNQAFVYLCVCTGDCGKRHSGVCTQKGSDVFHDEHCYAQQPTPRKQDAITRVTGLLVWCVWESVWNKTSCRQASGSKKTTMAEAEQEMASTPAPDPAANENLSGKEKEFQKAKSYLLTASTNTGINL